MQGVRKKAEATERLKEFVLYPPVRCTLCWTNGLSIGIAFLIIVLNDRAVTCCGKKIVEVRKPRTAKEGVERSRNDKSAESTHPADGQGSKERHQAKASFQEVNKPCFQKDLISPRALNEHLSYWIRLSLRQLSTSKIPLTLNNTGISHNCCILNHP